MRRLISLTLLGFFVSALLVPALPVFAQQPTPLGSEFQVNTYTTSYQSDPDVGMDDAGQFVVVWKSDGSPEDDNNGYSIQGQRHGSDGTDLGGQFQVNVNTSATVSQPVVGVAPNGDFVMVWKSTTPFPGLAFTLQGRRYSSDGMPWGGEFEVGSAAGNPQNPDVDMAPDGSFVVVWRDAVATGTDVGSASIQARLFDLAGVANGDQFQVNTYTTDNQRRATVSVLPNGDFVVAWQSNGADGASGQYSIQGQRFASNGLTHGGQFQINAYTTGDQTVPSVSVLADGGFVVAWQSEGSPGDDTADTSIQARRFASDGSPLAGDLQVNTHTPDGQYSPKVKVDADGDFVVVWESYTSTGNDSSSLSIQGRRYDSGGAPTGSQFQVNTFTAGGQYYPAVGMDSGGRFVVAWASFGSSGTDTDQDSIQGQRYDSPFDADPIFSDGFESGNTMAW